MTPITRKAAKAAGLKYYFTGKPCKRAGHIDRRYVAQFGCMTCVREKAKELFDRRDANWIAHRRAYNKARWQDPQTRRRALQYQRDSDQGKKRADNRAWKKANRASCTDRQNKRNATLYTVFVEEVSLAFLFERDKGRCQLCGWELNMTTQWPHPRTPTRDHVLPLSKGGTHERANLQLACAVCNIRKQDRVA
jgi:5-methylcytosine-specific restriction endonuclease McrA